MTHRPRRKAWAFLSSGFRFSLNTPRLVIIPKRARKGYDTLMNPPEPITSAANPRIKSAVKLRRSRDRRRSGLFLAEGPREVSRAISAGLDVVEVFYCTDLMSEQEIRTALSGRGDRVPVFKVTQPLLKMLAYRDRPEGLIAVVKQPSWSLDDLTDGGQAADKPPLFLVAVGTQKPGNLGAMARTAEAAGCVAVLSCGAPVDVFNPNTIRASTCAVYTLPVVNATDQDAVTCLRDHGIKIAATTPDPAKSRSYTDADLTGPLAIIIGPEDTGLSDTWLNAADQRLAIPTLGQTVDSLNAANAAAVVLFEAVRQRAGNI
jgi:RNA methyltransferase, TrmH family